MKKPLCPDEKPDAAWEAAAASLWGALMRLDEKLRESLVFNAHSGKSHGSLRFAPLLRSEVGVIIPAETFHQVVRSGRLSLAERVEIIEKTPAFRRSLIQGRFLELVQQFEGAAPSLIEQGFAHRRQRLPREFVRAAHRSSRRSASARRWRVPRPSPPGLQIHSRAQA